MKKMTRFKNLTSRLGFEYNFFSRAINQFLFREHH